MKQELELEIDTQVLKNAMEYAESIGTTVEKLSEDFLEDFVSVNRKA